MHCLCKAVGEATYNSYLARQDNVPRRFASSAANAATCKSSRNAGCVIAARCKCRKSSQVTAVTGSGPGPGNRRGRGGSGDGNHNTPAKKARTKGTCGRQVNGVWTHNRRGNVICQAFNALAGCANPKCADSHQCNKCLSRDHGGHFCNTQRDLSAAKPKKFGSKAGFKGKGKGKGGRK